MPKLIYVEAGLRKDGRACLTEHREDGTTKTLRGSFGDRGAPSRVNLRLAYDELLRAYPELTRGTEEDPAPRVGVVGVIANDEQMACWQANGHIDYLGAT